MHFRYQGILAKRVCMSRCSPHTRGHRLAPLKGCVRRRGASVAACSSKAFPDLEQKLSRRDLLLTLLGRGPEFVMSCFPLHLSAAQPLQDESLAADKVW